MKVAVISTDENQDYMYHIPLTIWAWRKIGWSVMVMFVSDNISELSELIFRRHTDLHNQLNVEVCLVPTIKGYRNATVAQISRLYAAAVPFVGDILMTSDGDMLPLSDYWKLQSKPTVYGFDLTSYTEFPISYIQMDSSDWKQVMNLDQNHNVEHFIKRDLDSMPNAKSDDFYKFWGVDQQLITQRLKPFKPTIINRGQYPNGYARGRVDRGAWTLDHKEFIDAHLHHQIHHKQNDWKFQQTLELLRKIWPEESFDWYIEYHNEFKRLTGHA